MVKQFVVDFTSETYKPLMEHEVNGLDYRYVYSDKARLSVVVQGIETGSASLLDANGELHAYYHCDYLGTTDYLTSAVNSKIISWTSYNEWGEITHNAVLKCGQRELDLVKEYATHDFDAVLNQYYAKARFYDADNRRFTAVDPIKDGLNWYAYCGNNPVNYIDPWGYAANPYDSIDWSKISTYKKGENTYYSTRDIFAQLGGTVDYDKGKKQATLTYNYGGKTVKLVYNMNNVVTNKLGMGVNGSSFTGALSGGGTAKAVTLIYANKKAYISQKNVKDYFKLVWCEEKGEAKGANRTVNVNNWLKLHTEPSGIPNNRTLIPDEAKTSSNWYSFEWLSNPNTAMGTAKQQIGQNDIVYVGSSGEFTDKDGRYWVAVGPKVLIPDYPDDGHIWASDFVYGTKIDAVFTEVSTGEKYYLYCVVGDIKAHTYPNGIYQTGKPYPNSWNASIGETGAADRSVIEFIGKGSTSGLSNYRIESIFVY